VKSTLYHPNFQLPRNPIETPSGYAHRNQKRKLLCAFGRLWSWVQILFLNPSLIFVPCSVCQLQLILDLLRGFVPSTFWGYRYHCLSFLGIGMFDEGSLPLFVVRFRLPQTLILLEDYVRRASFGNLTYFNKCTSDNVWSHGCLYVFAFVSISDGEICAFSLTYCWSTL